MIFSKNKTFSNNQAVTATAVSTDVVTLGKLGTPFGASAPLKRDLGRGSNPQKIDIRVTENFNNLTSLTISVEVDDNETFTSAATLFTSPAYTLAQLNDDRQILMPIVIPPGNTEQFMRLRYTVAGTAPTTGKIHAGYVAGHQYEYA